MVNQKFIPWLLLSYVFSAHLLVALDQIEELAEKQPMSEIAFVHFSPQMRSALLAIQEELPEHEWSLAFKNVCQDIRDEENMVVACRGSTLCIVDECLTALATYEGTEQLDKIKSAIQEYKDALISDDDYGLTDDMHLSENNQQNSCRGCSSKNFCKLCVGCLTVTRALNVVGSATISAVPGRSSLGTALTVNGDEIVNGTLTVNGELIVNGSTSGAVTSVSAGNGITITGASPATPIVNLTAPVSIANGGTNATAMANTDGVVYFDGTLLNTTSVGTSGQILTSRGPGLSPMFVSGSGGSGISSIVGDNDGTASGSSVNILGGNNITTSGDSVATLTINVSGATDHAVQIGNSTGSLSSVAVGASNTVLLGNTGADPSFGTVSNAALSNSSITLANGTGITVTGSPVSLGGTATINLSTPVIVANGGTGAITLTSDGVLLGHGTSAITATTAGTAGQVLLGSSTAPAFVTPTVGSGLSITTNATTLSYALSTPVSIANGGTNATTMANTGGAVYYDGTKLNTTAVGTVGQILTSNGTGASAPTFQTFTINNDSGSVSLSQVPLTLYLNATIGSGNTVKFVGSGTTVMSLNVSDGDSNTAVGSGAGNASMGTANTVFGQGAGVKMSNVNYNSAFGQAALLSLIGGGSFPDGYYNCALGQGSLQNLTGGSANIAIGQGAGSSLTGTEKGNIYLGSYGTAGENGVFRVSNTSNYGVLSAAYIDGIAGATVSGSPVLVSSGGQLGIATSARKYKENIQEVVSSKVLDLRPVTFNYKKSGLEDETHYGLIAEEVEEIIPDLAVYDNNKEPQTVKYHELPVLLLAQIKLLSAEVERLNTKVAALEAK